LKTKSLVILLLLALDSVLGATRASWAESIESAHLSNLRQVTSGFVKAGEGYFSPDGRTIIYQAVPQGYPFYQIYKQPLAGGEPQLISTGRGRTTCAYFSPDNRHLIFASSHLDPGLSRTEELERKQQAEDAASGRRRRYQWDFDPYTDIFECDLDGKNLRPLTREYGYDAEGAYSPDGKLIAFCSDRDGDPDLYVMNADGSGVRQLTNEPGYDGGPFISPDGKWVVYRTDRKKAEMLQIHAIGIDGKNDVALTDNVGVNWAPYWHPTKPYIIWTGADHSDPNARPNYDLWLMKYEVKDGKIAPGPITRITDHPSADVLPVFSPDGKQLMWTSNRTADRSSQLWIADFKLPE
jgi:TolB protein